MKTISFTSLRSRSEYYVEKTDKSVYIHKYGGLSGTYCGEAMYYISEFKSDKLVDIVNEIIDNGLHNTKFAIAGY